MKSNGIIENNYLNVNVMLRLTKKLICSK